MLGLVGDSFVGCTLSNPNKVPNHCVEFPLAHAPLTMAITPSLGNTIPMKNRLVAPWFEKDVKAIGDGDDDGRPSTSDFH